MLPKHKKLSADNPLFSRLHSVLLTLFCRGVIAATKKELIAGALMSLATSPFSWITSVLRRSLHILLIALIWVLLRSNFEAAGIPSSLVLTMALIGVLYSELYDAFLDLILDLAILLSQGSLLRWLCAGYLSDEAGLRPSLFTARPIEGLVARMINIVPTEYRAEYEKLLNLYIDSNDPKAEAKLRELLDGHTAEV